MHSFFREPLSGEPGIGRRPAVLPCVMRPCVGPAFVTQPIAERLFVGAAFVGRPSPVHSVFPSGRPGRSKTRK